VFVLGEREMAGKWIEPWYLYSEVAREICKNMVNRDCNSQFEAVHG
jgi:hypothetical protein